jgi:hypothetical protein
MINLMENETIPPCIEEEHKFVSTCEPENNSSGWHEDTCEKCGITIGYDTSD